MNFWILGLISIFSGFIAFAMGRIGDKYGGHLNAPHHWIYGLILMVLGVFWTNLSVCVILFSIGFGHFISGLDDFLHMRIWGPDKPHEWKFWSIK